MKNIKIETIDDYIAAQPLEKRASLEKFRIIIQKAAPKATEVISYGMPAFKQEGILVYFAAFRNHYGFFPTASPIIVFKKELLPYKTSKGAIQFPVEKPLPVKLIQAIVKYRIAQNKEKAAIKTGKK
ncbi:MAG: hypothetical protein RL262_161 [Bacteroidota bacterium]|jgi:uncharacterized protein YdhG (YjbR/CyaY superfamily)